MTSLDAAKSCDDCGRYFTNTLLLCPGCEPQQKDYDVFVAYLSETEAGHDPLEALEEVDILAIDEGSARRIAAWVVSEECGDFIPGLEVLDVQGPMIGFYL